ncbi:TolB family protein [Fodinibius sediminis]|uniref:Beta propeller repeat-containing protein n=1 Tax=Fodinibius sediminis TaxID=1214077 RepID=A0A521CDI0_9BACT|nr:hypothetical protein [Fodinibius sediminis]SMO56820.1 beta propeller repeat-containing protein [Fodinibius sediminis]
MIIRPILSKTAEALTGVILLLLVLSSATSCDKSNAILSATMDADSLDSVSVQRSFARTMSILGTEIQITTDLRHQVAPAISGDYLVWEDSRSGDGDIYLYDLSTATESRITTNPAQQGKPAISNGRVVWVDERNHENGESTFNADIYLYNLANGTEFQITTDPAGQFVPAISGNQIVWEDDRSGKVDIYRHNLTTATESLIATSRAGRYFPSISGGRIAWIDDRNGAPDIYMYDLDAATELPVTSDPAEQYHPSISGEHIVWMDNRNGNWDIYLYNLTTGTESRITHDPASQMNPSISGNRIVWIDNRDGNWHVYLYNLISDTEYRITTDQALPASPVISGNNIVWEDFRNGNWDIYLYKLIERPLSITSFLTGSGWIDSPAGAYPGAPGLSGGMKFEIVSKYQPRFQTPNGTIRFVFETGDFKFHSSSHDWLVVDGAKALLKGSGTVNGNAGICSFLISAVDGSLNEGNESDKIRIKIWDETGIIYDTNQGNADDANPTMEITRGDITIHQ